VPIKWLRKIGGGWQFFLATLCLYVALAPFAPMVVQNALAQFVSLLARIVPILALVFGLIFLSHLLLDERRITGLIGRQSGLKGWLIAVTAGIISAGPIYVWYAFLKDLRDKGMRTSLIAAFLYSRGIKLPLLPLMIYYFGVPYMCVLTLYLALFSILSGLLMERIADRPVANRR
jgi:uncharacterized membrane protein YraQ (UPF0718 family)